MRPNSSTVDSAVRCPIWTAPDPIRIVEVAAAVRARRTAGEVRGEVDLLARPGHIRLGHGRVLPAVA